MNKEIFWDIIHRAGAKAGTWEDICEPLAGILTELSVADLLKWGLIFDEYQKLSYKNKLWAAAYVINGGCSDDGFDYFRGGLTALGKEVFMSALKDPDSLAEVTDCARGDVELEDMLGIDAQVFFKTQNIDWDYDLYFKERNQYALSDAEKDSIKAEIPYGDDIDTVWDSEDESALKAIVPKLCEVFGW